MKKVRSAFVIAVIIFALAFTEFHLTKITSNETINLIEKTEISAMSNSDETEQLCGEIKNLWDKRKPELEIFLSHGDMDKIDISIENLIRYSEQRKFDYVYTECGILKNHMTSLQDGELVNLQNVF